MNQTLPQFSTVRDQQARPSPRVVELQIGRLYDIAFREYQRLMAHYPHRIVRYGSRWEPTSYRDQLSVSLARRMQQVADLCDALETAMGRCEAGWHEDVDVSTFERELKALGLGVRG